MAIDETIEFGWEKGAAKGFLARPDDGGDGRAVIIVHEWWGLNEHTMEVARRYAAEGFVALAPDLYGGVVTADAQEASKLMHGLDTDRGVAILDGAIDALGAADGVDENRIGVTGFCMGGSFALLFGCRNRSVRAVAPFYGDIPSDDEIAKLEAPVLFIGASEDKWITPAKVEGLRASLERHGKQGEVKIYEGADHAFFNDTRPEVHDPAAAADAWRRVVEFFRRSL